MALPRLKPQPKPLRDKELFKIGIICAKGEEMDAIIASLDHFFSKSEERSDTVHMDDHSYTFGTIGRHHIVLSGTGGKGNIKAKDAAKDMYRTFGNIRLCLVVGICGIAPQIEKKDAILGDVIMSKEVVYYTEGKYYPTGFRPENMLAKTSNTAITSSFEQLRSPKHLEALRKQLHENLKELMVDSSIQALGYRFPGRQNDDLYEEDYLHVHHDQACPECCAKRYCQSAVDSLCENLLCSREHLVKARPRLSNVTPVRDTTYALINQSQDANDHDATFLELDSTYLPEVFIGKMASGDVVLKDGKTRDILVNEHEMVGFEMEGAGASSTLPTVVIKAGCDYADSHKAKHWQAWAAMTAASCAKAYVQQIQMGIATNVEFEAESTAIRSSTHASSTLRGQSLMSQCAEDNCSNNFAKGDFVAWNAETNQLFCKVCATTKFPDGYHSVHLKLEGPETQQDCIRCGERKPFDGLLDTHRNKSSKGLHICCRCIGMPDRMAYVRKKVQRSLKGTYGHWEFVRSAEMLSKTRFNQVVE